MGSPSLPSPRPAAAAPTQKLGARAPAGRAAIMPARRGHPAASPGPRPARGPPRGGRPEGTTRRAQPPAEARGRPSCRRLRGRRGPGRAGPGGGSPLAAPPPPPGSPALALPPSLASGARSRPARTDRRMDGQTGKRDPLPETAPRAGPGREQGEQRQAGKWPESLAARCSPLALAGDSPPEPPSVLKVKVREAAGAGERGLTPAGL